MRESTLNLSRAYLEGTIGDMLGWGKGSENGETAWDSYTSDKVTEIRASGERFFYYNPPVPRLGVPAAITWSFVRPTRQLDLRSGSSLIELPDDFAAIDGDVLLVDSSRATFPIRRRGDVREMQAAWQTRTGEPECVELEWVDAMSAEEGQRAVLRVFPTADDDYVVQVRYTLAPDSLSGTRPYAYGGPAHAETVKAACRAAAELYRDKTRGTEWMNFEERLATSYQIDARQRPSNLGYNDDASDEVEAGRRFLRGDWPTVTIGGITPS